MSSRLGSGDRSGSRTPPFGDTGRPALVAVRQAWRVGQHRHDVADGAPARVDAEKKSIRATEQTRPDVAAARQLWRRLQPQLKPERLVFLEETWTKTNMTPLRGRARRGQRVLGATPFGHWNQHFHGRV